MYVTWTQCHLYAKYFVHFVVCPENITSKRLFLTLRESAMIMFKSGISEYTCNTTVFFLSVC